MVSAIRRKNGTNFMESCSGCGKKTARLYRDAEGMICLDCMRGKVSMVRFQDYMIEAGGLFNE